MWILNNATYDQRRLRISLAALLHMEVAKVLEHASDFRGNVRSVRPGTVNVLGIVRFASKDSSTGMITSNCPAGRVALAGQCSVRAGQGAAFDP